MRLLVVHVASHLVPSVIRSVRRRDGWEICKAAVAGATPVVQLYDSAGAVLLQVLKKHVGSRKLHVFLQQLWKSTLL